MSSAETPARGHRPAQGRGREWCVNAGLIPGQRSGSKAGQWVRVSFGLSGGDLAGVGIDDLGDGLVLLRRHCHLRGALGYKEPCRAPPTMAIDPIAVPGTRSTPVRTPVCQPSTLIEPLCPIADLSNVRLGSRPAPSRPTASGFCRLLSFETCRSAIGHPGSFDDTRPSIPERAGLGVALRAGLFGFARTGCAVSPLMGSIPDAGAAREAPLRVEWSGANRPGRTKRPG